MRAFLNYVICVAQGGPRGKRRVFIVDVTLPWAEQVLVRTTPDQEAIFTLPVILMGNEAVLPKP